MKVIVDIKEDQKDLFLALMKENNIHYEVEEDFEIPKWQMEEEKVAVCNPEVDECWQYKVWTELC